MDQKTLGLYLHIPFCVQKCRYCDFTSYAGKGEEFKNRYVKCLITQIQRLATAPSGGLPALSGRFVDSIFFGGGTPSLLSPEQLGEIMAEIRRQFVLAEDCEITMEANPGTLSPEKLVSYRNAGVNRLSIGLQSADDGCLRMLGRIHSWQDFCENYEQARKAGFDNINIDIMSALPGQSLESYLHTLKEVTALRPEHISSYSLILEEGTPLYDDEQLLKLLPDEETDRRMYEMTKKVLDEEGYHRYEISNYAREGKECIHNLGYWEDIPYLGFGLGASSYWKKGKTRRARRNI
jgi:oxygen-independent coproporphyrinogen-3 oxidase